MWEVGFLGTPKASEPVDGSAKRAWSAVSQAANDFLEMNGRPPTRVAVDGAMPGSTR